MPDIREVLAALDDNDKRLWSLHRTEMRRSYMTAHNSILGMAAWDFNDDAFIDLIDIKLATLFDRAGRLDTPKTLVGKDAEKIEAAILSDDDKLKKNAERITNWKDTNKNVPGLLHYDNTPHTNGSLAAVDKAVAREQGWTSTP